jgi:uncharacterized membrane protein YjgN (DUF898 family)
VDLNAEQAGYATSKPLTAQRNREYFRFHGNGAEYFRIWIVNFLLTLLTLGVYSAWAKVRKNRYIYGSTELAGSYFDYLAEPVRILRGRLLAIGLLLALFVFQSFMPLLNLGILALLSLFTPWLIVRARMFNMRYTAYRNVRFGFKPAYGEAYETLLLWGLLSVLTLGMAAPYAHFRRNSLLVNNTRFGNLHFRLAGVAGKFYFAYFVGFVMGFLLLVPLVTFVGQQANSPATGADSVTSVSLAILPIFLAIAFYFVAVKFSAALLLRITTNNTTIGGAGDSARRHSLGSDWSLPVMLWIYLSNLVVLILSLGLLTPWAQVRILKYQLDHTWVDLAADIDEVVAVESGPVSSVGEEIGDLFDIDIGL